MWWLYKQTVPSMPSCKTHSNYGLNLLRIQNQTKISVYKATKYLINIDHTTIVIN